MRRLRICAALALVVLMVDPRARGAQAGGGEGFTLEAILSAPFAAELRASPDGRRMAWLVDERGSRSVWGAEGPGFRPRRLASFASDDGQSLSELTWSPDGETLVFVRGGGRSQLGEIPNPTSDPAGSEQAVWAASFASGRPRRLGAGAAPAVSAAGEVAFVLDGQIWGAPLQGSIPARQLAATRGRSSTLAWSPDGKTLAFRSDRDDHSFIALYDPARSTVRFVAPSIDRDHTPRWSPDGRRVAFVRQPGRGGEPAPPGADDVPQPWSIWVADASSLAARRVWASGARPEDSLPRTADSALLQWAGGGRLVFASEADGWLHLYALSADGGRPVLLTPGECEVEEVALTPDRRAIVYSSNCGDVDRRHLRRVAVDGASPAAVTRGEANEWSPAPLGDGAVAFLRSDARQPGAPWLAPASGEARPLAADAVPEEFPASRLVAPQPVAFKAADGWEIRGQLFIAAGSSPARRPAVLYMHGGPIRQMLLGWHYRQYYHYCYAMNQYLASRGYVVLSVNYRSGTGYGRRFREAPGRGARGAAEYQDIVAAAQYLEGRTDVDRARIGLWGGSYGGYLTALGLARNSDLFAAGVDIHGVHDWSTRRFRPWAGTESAEVVKRARDSSPVASVASWRSPVLLIHGDDDRNVDFSQTVDLAERLRARGVEFEQLVFPDEVHDFLLHRHWLETFRAASDFFDRKLKGAEPGASSGER